MEKFWIAEELFKTEENQEDGWIYKFSPKVTRKQIDKIVYTIHDELELSVMALGKPVVVIVTNNKFKSNKDCIKEVETIMKRILYYE